MGCDWYSFAAIGCRGNSILVPNKDLKEAHGKEKTVPKKEQVTSTQPDSTLRDHPLTREEIAWLLNQTKGFKVYQLGGFAVLISTSEIVQCPTLEVAGPYEIEDNFIQCSWEAAQDPKDYKELVKVARKLTPPGQKLAFVPGEYQFSTMNDYMLRVQKLTMDDEDEDEAHARSAPPVETAAIPYDFELIVGKGDLKKTIETNKTVLCCYFPGIEEQVTGGGGEKLELPDLDPKAVEIVLGHYSTRSNVEMPEHGDEMYEQVESAKAKFGIQERTTPAQKKGKTEHPFLSDPRWLDVSFLVGPNNEVVKGNRAVLGSMNNVLHRLLYGTGEITPTSKPIDWSQFDVGAVRCVLLALVLRGKQEVVVPDENVESALELVDYLMETGKELNLSFYDAFKRDFGYGGSFKLTQRCDDETEEEFLEIEN